MTIIRRWTPKSKRYFLLILLILVLLGFILNIFTYETLSFPPEVGLTFSRLPRKWNQVINYQRKYSAFIPNATIAEWDSPTLMNLTFKWISNNESLCKMQSDDHYLMPVLIHTARSHFVERLAIRRSWGSSDKLHFIALKKWRVQPVFLLGEEDPSILSLQPKDKDTQKLMEEQEKYGDLIIGNFIDSYRNLTYKHLMGYKWILNFCQNAQFVLKIDDDIFIDIFKWIRWRLQDLERNSDYQLPSLYCFTHGGAMPRRKISDKWYISQDIYSEDYYPEYCMGGSYGMTVDHIKRIYYISNFAKFIWIDDLFVTGILPEVGEMWFKYKNVVRNLPWKSVQIDQGDLKEGLCGGGTAAVVFVKRGELFEREMMCLWNKTVQIEHKIN